VKSWLLFAVFIAAVLIKRRFAPDPLVELDRAADAPTPRWELLGPYGPGEMPPDLQAQWDTLKRTGIGPNHPDF
jgi:hypothetical protein